MQENKPVLELKNTGKKVCQELKWKENISHCTLVGMPALHWKHYWHTHFWVIGVDWYWRVKGYNVHGFHTEARWTIGFQAEVFSINLLNLC